MTTSAQHDISSTTFWSNYSHLNPAMSALEYKRHGSFMYRNDQKGSISNDPSILANYNISLANKHGIGVNYGFSDIPFFKQHSFNLNYNYQFIFKEGRRKLSVGTGVGTYANTINPDYIAGVEFLDSTVVITEKLRAFNLNAGIAYNSGSFMLGIAANNLLEDALSNREDGEMAYYPARSVVVNGHYKIKLGKKKGLEIRPQIILRTDFSFTSTDLNILATFRNKYWAGYTYKGSSAYSFMFGWDIKEKLRIGYAFDIVQSQLSLNQRAHEINLGIFLK